MIGYRLLGVLGAALACMAGTAASVASDCPAALNVELRQLHSSKVHNLCDFYRADKPLLIINTASHCGYTKQFAGLEALHKQYKDDGLVVLGFPSNSFKQEEQSEQGTARVCYENYGVSFTMFEHVEVTGENAHPVFRYLAEQSQAPQWNFNKYLLHKGKVQHFGSKVAPDSAAIDSAITATLSDSPPQHRP